MHDYGEILTFQDSLTAIGGYDKNGEVEVFRNNTWNDNHIEPLSSNMPAWSFSALVIDNFIMIFGK